MLSNSYLIKDFICSTVLVLLCCIFNFMTHQMFSVGERSALQAGQFITRTLLLQSHAVAIAALCDLALPCWNMQDLACKTQHLGGSICCSKTCTYLSALMAHFHIWKMPIPKALKHFHTIRDSGFSNLMLTTNWIVLLSSLLSRLQFLQRRFSSFDLSYQGTVLHLTSVLFKLALVQRKLWHFCVMFTYGFFLTRWSFSLHLWMRQQTVVTVISGCVLEAVQWFQWQDHAFLYCLRAWRLWASNIDFWPCVFVQGDFSRFLESFVNIMCYRR